MYYVHYQKCNDMKKHYCICNNRDLVCCMSKLSLKSDVGVQTNFSDKKPNNHKNIDRPILTDLFIKNYSGCYNSDQPIAEAEAILGELGKIGAITCE